MGFRMRNTNSFIRPTIGLGWCLALLTHNVNAQAPAVSAAAGPAAVAISAKTALSSATPPELGPEQIIPIILAHNPQLRAAQSARVAAKSGITAAQALLNPRLDWHQGRNTARLPGVTSGSAQQWAISQPIENPAARSARIEAANATEQESAHLIGLTRNALVSQARLRIYQGLLHKAQAAASA
jgi:cobalt-zinc-cadmium efflux system outer membrane protein